MLLKYYKNKIRNKLSGIYATWFVDQVLENIKTLKQAKREWKEIKNA